jgi:hypothetical protein
MAGPAAEVKVAFAAAGKDKYDDLAEAAAPRLLAHLQELLLIKHRAMEVTEQQLSCKPHLNSCVRITGTRVQLKLSELEQLWLPHRTTCTDLTLGFGKDAAYVDLHFRPGTSVRFSDLSDVQRMQLGEKKRLPLTHLADLLHVPDDLVAAPDRLRVARVQSLLLRIVGKKQPRDCCIKEGAAPLREPPARFARGTDVFCGCVCR